MLSNVIKNVKSTKIPLYSLRKNQNNTTTYPSATYPQNYWVFLVSHHARAEFHNDLAFHLREDNPIRCSSQSNERSANTKLVCQEPVENVFIKTIKSTGNFICGVYYLVKINHTPFSDAMYHQTGVLGHPTYPNGTICDLVCYIKS